MFKLWDHCYALDLLYSKVYACWKWLTELCLTNLKETHKDRQHKFSFPKRKNSVSGWMNILFHLSISLRELEGKAVHLESQKTLMRGKKEDCGFLSETIQHCLMTAEKNLFSYQWFFFERKNSETKNKKLKMCVLQTQPIVLCLIFFFYLKVEAGICNFFKLITSRPSGHINSLSFCFYHWKIRVGKKYGKLMEMHIIQNKSHIAEVLEWWY